MCWKINQGTLISQQQWQELLSQQSSVYSDSKKKVLFQQSYLHVFRHSLNLPYQKDYATRIIKQSFLNSRQGGQQDLQYARTWHEVKLALKSQIDVKLPNVMLGIASKCCFPNIIAARAQQAGVKVSDTVPIGENIKNLACHCKPPCHVVWLFRDSQHYLSFDSTDVSGK